MKNLNKLSAIFAICKSAIIVFIFILSLTSCKGKNDNVVEEDDIYTDEYYTVNSYKELGTYLAGKRANTADRPYNIALNVDEITNIDLVLNDKSGYKYVNLDLSGSTFTIIGKKAFGGCAGLTGVTIPKSVTSIEDGAFNNCTSLVSVSIPVSVTSIGEWVFLACTSLTSINVDPDNTKYTSVDNVLYNKNRTAIIAYPVGKEDGFFTIPNNVTGIGENAFAYCSNLASIKIPDSVTSIGDAAFLNCGSLTSVKIPDNVTRIGNDAFAYCSNLTGSINIPDNVTYIGKNAFYACKNLTSVIIGNNVTAINWKTFYECTSLTNVIIPYGVTYLGDFVFWGCKNLKDVVIPNSVTGIGNQAFAQCSSLKIINIPDSVTKIEDGAFIECTGLTDVTIDCNIDKWHKIFSKTNNITSLTIGKNAVDISSFDFDACFNLNKINVDIDNTAYSIVDGILYNKRITALIKCPQRRIEVVNIPDSVTKIGEEAFRLCSNLIGINIPDGVTEIADEAFYFCARLTAINIPDSVNEIGDRAFIRCDNLTRVTFEGIMSYGLLSEYAFTGDLETKYFKDKRKYGMPGTYTTTAPVNDYSIWERILTADTH